VSSKGFESSLPVGDEAGEDVGSTLIRGGQRRLCHRWT